MEHDGPARLASAVPPFRIWPPVAVSVPWLIGYASDRALWPTSDAGLLSTSVAQAAGWTLVAAFVLWNGWCLVLFRRHRTGLLPGQATSSLLTTGPYRWSRNPLYVGLVACYLGLAILVESPTALVLAPVAWAALHWGAVLPEEGYLADRLGDPYVDYCQRVRRWL